MNTFGIVVIDILAAALFIGAAAAVTVPLGRCIANTVCGRSPTTTEKRASVRRIALIASLGAAVLAAIGGYFALALAFNG